MKSLAFWFPWLVVGGCALWIGGRALPPDDPAGAMRIEACGRIPVVYQGRVQPLDSLARNSLRVISGRQTFVDEQGRSQPAIRWLLDAVSRSTPAPSRRVFRIENPVLLATLGLEARDGFRYAVDEFEAKAGAIDDLAASARGRMPEQRDAYDAQVVKFADHLQLYATLVESFDCPAADSPEELQRVLQRYEHIRRFPLVLAAPPQAPEEPWQPVQLACLMGAASGRPHPAVGTLSRLLAAYAGGDAEGFNRALADHETLLARLAPADWRPAKADFEAYFNHVQPFEAAAALYFIAFGIACVAWLGWGAPLARAASLVMGLALVLHTVALGARIYISGRPPVTNLYSSAVFIGWGAVLLSFALEAVFRLGLARVVGAAAGFLTLLIAHALAADGDTFEMLQAVLDTQFWLATHVVCITLGYATTYVAGMLAVLAILRGVLTRSMTPALMRDAGRMIYGTLCFATFFSFVGTVLGGLWADDSWGRFWGWDPKENGALIIVLWNALVLHARWGGMVRDRGTAVLAVFGNIVTSWSWFGVNMLGVGLHNYGFMEKVLFWLEWFVASQLAVIALGAMPMRRWRSFAGAQAGPVAAGTVPGTGAGAARGGE